MLDNSLIPIICVDILRSESELFSDLVRISGLDKLKDFRYSDLSGVDFMDSDLSDYDFTGTNLRGSDLSKANLTNTVFDGANLDCAVLPDGFGYDAEEIHVLIQREIHIHPRLEAVSGSNFDCKKSIVIYGHLSIGVLNADLGVHFRNISNIISYYKMILKTEKYYSYKIKYSEFVKICLENIDIPNAYQKIIIETYGISINEMTVATNEILRLGNINHRKLPFDMHSVIYSNIIDEYPFEIQRVPLCGALMAALFIKDNYGI